MNTKQMSQQAPGQLCGSSQPSKRKVYTQHPCTERLYQQGMMISGAG